jgi:hypothetical protein
MKTFIVLFILLLKLSLNTLVSAQGAVPVWCNSSVPPGDTTGTTLACPNLTQFLLTEIGHAMNDYIYQMGILAQTNRSCLPYPDYTSWWGTKFYGYFGGNSTYFSLRDGSNVNDDIWSDDGFLTSRRKRRHLAVCSCDPNCKAATPGTRCFFLFCGNCRRRRLREVKSSHHDTKNRETDGNERETLEDEKFMDNSASEEDEEGDVSDIISQRHNVKSRSFANVQKSGLLHRRELQAQTIAQFAQARLRNLAVTGNITNASCLWFLNNARCFS